MVNTNDLWIGEENLGKWPWGTLLALLATLVLCITHIVDPDTVSLDSLSTQIVVVWGALAVGRGLAANPGEGHYEEDGPITRFLNSFSWATVGVGLFAVTGYITMLVAEDSSLTWDGYATKVGIVAGALAVGRGIAKLKKDATIGAVAIETRYEEPGPDVEITDENLPRLSVEVGIEDIQLSGDSDSGDVGDTAGNPPKRPE